MSTKAQPRRPPGTPVGGQWAPTQHDEPDIALPQAVPQAAQSAFGSPEVLALVQSEARKAAYRFSLDADDVADETMLKLLSGSHNADNLHAYAVTATRNVAKDMYLRATAGVELSTYEMRAWQMYRAECARLEQKLWRHLTGPEEDALAEQVRARIDRVPAGFHRRPKRKLVQGTLPEPADGYSYHRRSAFPAGSLADRAERMAENDVGRCNLAAISNARMIGWDALAELDGAPLAAIDSLSRKQATRVRHQVRGAGGVNAVVAAHRAGTLDEQTARAFFAPWGEIDESGRDAVTKLLRKHGAYADDLWDAAVGRSVHQARGTEVAA